MGTAEEAIKYLDRRFYISLTGYLCKVNRVLVHINNKKKTITNQWFLQIIRTNQIQAYVVFSIMEPYL